ncbi:unnamed protein product [Rodentolepis nana]|uniref:Uncharacterized protein n=1 Tax=Rodentolepis nana TaxID=102285 RepID=A0A0R3T2M3_RODNA|nr:unnamed protein product [Rodentolepis nana]
MVNSKLYFNYEKGSEYINKTANIYLHRPSNSGNEKYEEAPREERRGEGVKKVSHRNGTLQAGASQLTRARKCGKLPIVLSYARKQAYRVRACVVVSNCMFCIRRDPYTGTPPRIYA